MGCAPLAQAFRHQVMVVGDQVLLGGPCPVVQRLEEVHEVGRHRLGGVLSQDLRLRPEAVEKLVGREAPEVELLGGVDRGPVCRSSRGEHLGPVVVVLAPERCSPGVVELVEPSIALPQPGAERFGGRVAVAVPVVAAVLVVDVPHHDRRVRGIPLDDCRGEPCSRGPVVR